MDYKALKKQLKLLIAQKEKSLDGDEAFKKALDVEIEKVVLFFLEKQGDFAGQLAKLRQKQRTMFSSSVPESFSQKEKQTIRALSDGYRAVGDDLIRLVHYIELNATGLRKILKKHDKNVQNRKITGSYIASRVDVSGDSHLQQLYHYEGIAAIVTTIRAALRELRILEESITLASGGTPILDRRTSVSELEPVLGKISHARRRLQQSTQYVKTFAAQSLIFEEEEQLDEYETFGEVKKRESTFSNFLNLMSTFLYMMNYYIVAPTSGQYAALLGGSPALSGIIIGMTPIAALVSAVLYSWWANRSYKSALLFASVCSIGGNLLYAMALPCNSIGMVMAGRILNGFGGARAINRRYIADSYQYNERTAASALFVTAGALGMSAGPAASVVLNTIPDGPFLTVETAPGWLMFVIWIFYFIVTLIGFQEPDRTPRSAGLVAKAAREQERVQAAELGEMNNLLPAAPAQKSRFELIVHNVPVMTTLIIYFVLKLVLECLLSSTATLTSWYFQWNVNESGIYLAVLGLLMFPANICLGWLSYRYDDRDLMMWSMVWMAIGIFTIVSYSATYSSLQYVTGAIFIFLSTNILEGVNMSLLSKTIPKSLAKGTFNSGLLATEAGTFGRAVGDNLVTLVGLSDLGKILNYTFFPLGILTLVMIVATKRLYPYLVPRDEE